MTPFSKRPPLDRAIGAGAAASGAPERAQAASALMVHSLPRHESKPDACGTPDFSVWSNWTATALGECGQPQTLFGTAVPRSRWVAAVPAGGVVAALPREAMVAAQPREGLTEAVPREAMAAALPREEVVAAVPRAGVLVEARRWLGTPYLHQAARRSAGADCLGLIRGIWRELAGAEPQTPPAYSPDWSEASGDERLWAAAQRHLRQVSAAQLASVLLFRMRPGAVAKHLGVVSQMGPLGPLRFIHAYSGQGVVESNFTASWRRSLVAAFDFPWISD